MSRAGRSSRVTRPHLLDHPEDVVGLRHGFDTVRLSFGSRSHYLEKSTSVIYSARLLICLGVSPSWNGGMSLRP